MEHYLLSVLSNIGMLSFLAISAYLLLTIGEISFGQQAFFAIGAYAGGIATTLWNWHLAPAFLLAALVGAAAAGLLGAVTLRTSGLYFAIATLAFAELVRLGFEVWSFRREVGGEVVGPDGPDGFRDIRYVFEHDISQLEFMAIIYLMLGALIASLVLFERARWGSVLRLIGADPLLAETQGIRVKLVKVAVAAAAGAIAAVGGCLYAHLTTYIEPKLFNIMLGVHALAYGLIGGLGTVFGPLLGVFIDIGLLESVRAFQSYRMIVFGGLVALILIVMPRGILDENRVRSLRKLWRKSRTRVGPAAA
jgi:branched-chain amino acid transport system permease protein